MKRISEGFRVIQCMNWKFHIKTLNTFVCIGTLKYGRKGQVKIDIQQLNWVKVGVKSTSLVKFRSRRFWKTSSVQVENCLRRTNIVSRTTCRSATIVKSGKTAVSPRFGAKTFILKRPSISIGLACVKFMLAPPMVCLWKTKGYRGFS